MRLDGEDFWWAAAGGGGLAPREAAEKFSMGALEPTNGPRLFLTHLHSDHTLGYADIILTPWVTGRREALDVFGPRGTAAMTEHLKLAYSDDIWIRTQDRKSTRLNSSHT